MSDLDSKLRSRPDESRVFYMTVHVSIPGPEFPPVRPHSCICPDDDIRIGAIRIDCKYHAYMHSVPGASEVSLARVEDMRVEDMARVVKLGRERQLHELNSIIETAEREMISWRKIHHEASALWFRLKAQEGASGPLSATREDDPGPVVVEGRDWPYGRQGGAEAVS